MSAICEFAGVDISRVLVTYNYNGQTLHFHPDELCPDCSTPVVWVEDEDPDEPEPYIGVCYHDATCPLAKAGEEAGDGDQFPVWGGA